MKLDKQKILAQIEEIRKGKSDRSTLKELLGGEELKEIFDEDTISSLEEVLIETDKIHNSLSEQENFTTLEGLLNKKILGNLGEFYNIKPEFILTLPKEEQAKLAHTFAEGDKELEELLQKLWEKNVKTIACGGKREDAYLRVKLPKKDSENLTRMEAVSNKEENEVDIFTYENEITITVYGKKQELYKDVLAEYNKDKKTNKFIEKLIDSMEDEKNFIKPVEEKSKNMYSEEYVEELVTETAKELYEQYQEEKKTLESTINKKQEEIEVLSQKYDKLLGKHGKLKDFVVHKIGKIPFLGRRVLKMMEQETKALPEGKEER